MGRKIPAKKHRGVKDPLLQQAKRLESLKSKINAPPEDPDEQPVPKSLTRLFAFRDQHTRKNVAKKKISPTRRLIPDTDGSTSGPAHNPISGLRKLPGESGRGFSLRINSAVRALHNSSERLHYPLDIEAEDEKGLRMTEQRERRARKRRKAARAVRADPAGAADPAPHLTRTQKLALKKKAKKIKASKASAERHDVVYERVSFGEVTHAPPSLHFKSKGNTGAPRPGRRSLLLSSLLAGGSEAGGTRAGGTRAGGTRAGGTRAGGTRAGGTRAGGTRAGGTRAGGTRAGGTPAGGNRAGGTPAGGTRAGGTRAGGTRSLPPAERQRRERARLDAVAAYRALKAANFKVK